MKPRTLPSDDRTELYRANWSPEKSEPEIEPGAIYGAIQCVPVRGIPDRAPTKVKVPYGTWSALVEEIMLRLEQAPRKEALFIPFANAAITRRAYTSTRNLTRKQYGSGVVEVYRRGNSLYVRRGQNWGKESDPALTALSK